MAGEFPYWIWSPIYYNDSVLGIPEQVKGMAGSVSTLVNGWDPVALAPALLQIDNASGGLKVSGSFSASTVATATAAAPTYSEGSVSPLSMDLGGNLRIAGTINANSTVKSTAAAPTYVEGSTNPFSSDLAGNLRITGSISASSTVRATTAAPTYVNGTDNPFSADLAGNLRVAGPLTDTQLRATALPVSGTFWQATQPVSGTFWQATQPVSGTFWQATQPVSGPLTDTQLRAVAVPVSGTFWQTTQPVSIASMPSTPVTGTFWQATQPVSGPLTDTQLRATAVPVSGTFWQATQPVSGTFWQATQPVSGPLTDTQLRATSVPVSGPLTDTQLRASAVPVSLATAPSTPTTQVDTVATGTISATDALCPAPGGAGVLLSTAPTASSFVAIAIPGGSSNIDAMITGTATGTYYFEYSMDSTNGSDGNWVSANFRQSGTLNTVLVFGATANGIYRGNASGFKYARLRNVGGTTPSNPVTWRVSNGSGTAFLNASLPAGSNLIGKTGMDPTTPGVTNGVVENAAAGAGGISSTARMASAAASTNATNVKTTAGRIYSLSGKNNAAYDIFLVLYDALANPPVPGTTTIRKKMVCPAGSAFVYDWPVGLSFATGIGYAFTKLVADADTTLLAAADITAFNMDYV